MDTNVTLPVFGPSNPPCMVCHGKGSGLHYGVNTCQACKGFFIRCMTRKTVMTCKYKNKCAVAIGLKQCAACRFKKCISLGMSKEACTPGRRSSAKRTHVIEQVHQLEIQAKINKEGTAVTPVEYKQNMDDVVQLLAKTRLETVPNDAEHLEAMLDCEKNFIEDLHAKESLFGKRGPVNRKEYIKIYELTGLDVDGRKELAKQMIPLIQRAMDDLLKFAKCVPGFDRVPQRDQLKLLKYSAAEMNVFLYSHYYNVDSGLIVQPYDPSIIMTVQDLTLYSDKPPEELLECCHILTSKVQQLDLTIEEAMMCAALSMMIADTPLCRYSRNIASSSADYLCEILERELVKNHEPEDHILSKIFQIITESRSYGEVYTNALKNFVEDCLDLGLPKSLVELGTS